MDHELEELSLRQQINLWNELHIWSLTTNVWQQFNHCSIADVELGIQWAAYRWLVGQRMGNALGAQTVTDIVQ